VLSWSRIAVVSDLSTVPAGPVPLYLLIEGTPDVRSLAVDLKWSPNSIFGPCYYLIPKDSSTAGCKRTSLLDPPGSFEGDSAYTWEIAPHGATPNCVAFIVGGDNCDGRSANFCIVSVKTMDSEGAVDDLGVVGDATIMGGAPDACPLVAQDIYPHVAVQGQDNTFTVHGRGLPSDTWVSLLDDGLSATASSVTIAGDTTAVATIPVPVNFSGALDVVVRSGETSDTLTGKVVIADPSGGRSPVWRIDVDHTVNTSRASVVANEFTNPAYPAMFPIRALPIKRRTEMPGFSGGHPAPTISVDLAALEFDANGRPSAEPLAFRAASSFSVDRWTGEIAVLSYPNARTVPNAAAHLVVCSIPGEADQQLLDWDRSPDGRWFVVRSGGSTFVFADRRSSPLRSIAGQTYGGAFSKDGTRYAAILSDARGKRWIVLRQDGSVEREGAPETGAISQVDISPAGDVLTIVRQQDPRTAPRTVAINLSNGQERFLDAVLAGARYYSEDGRTMAVLTRSPGSLRLYDVSDRLHPIQLAAPLEPPDAHFITAAVSGDGALVALQGVAPEDNPSHVFLSVRVFDRGLKEQPQISPRTLAAGLQFAGRFLLVGTQRHPSPSYFDVQATTQITLYDLSSP